MGPEMIIMVVILFGGLFLMNSFAKRSQKKRQDERETMLKDQMVAGAWVQTFSGFFGRYVDTDGDVVILETPSGEETYWLKGAVKGVIEPPFEALLEEAQAQDDEALPAEITAPDDASELDDLAEELPLSTDDDDAVQQAADLSDGDDQAKENK